eukprot:TRINITY_DN2813_c0_g1_i1.p1 TRINITY_DN2813_c0_g1~~TRINITY_DN2813_c0_g1_i1.p1  ORF type:complete len:550 (-),score=139.90 TRINITY_DN2813_c0_g1_i1:95-1744(-)
MSDPGGITAGAAIMLVISVIAITASAVLFVLHRDSPMVAARNKLLTALIFVGTSFPVLLFSLLAFTPIRLSAKQNNVFKFIPPFVVLLLILPYVIKAFRLLVKFEVSYYNSKKMTASLQKAKGIVSNKSSGRQNSRRQQTKIQIPENWYVKNRRLISKRYGFGFFLLGGVFAFFPPFLLVDPLALFGVELAFVCLLLVFSAIIAVKLSDKFDAWGIKQELKRLIVLGIFACIFWTLLAVENPYDDVWGVFIWLTFLFVHIVSIFLPLFGAQMFKRNAQKNASPIDRKSRVRLQGLRLYVEDEKRLAAFQEHLQNEFSVENLAFVRECWELTELRKQQEAAPSAEMAREIIMISYRLFQEYIREDSPSTLNLAYGTRQEIKKRFPLLKAMYYNLKNSTPREDEDGSEDAGEGFRSETTTPRDRLSSDENIIARPKTSNPTKDPPTRPPSTASESRPSGGLGGAIPLGNLMTIMNAEEVPEEILTMFDEAESAIIALMERDSFLRFKHSPLYIPMSQEDAAQVAKVTQSTEALIHRLIFQKTSALSFTTQQ